jgi:hypothetical protein
MFLKWYARYVVSQDSSIYLFLKREIEIHKLEYAFKFLSSDSKFNTVGIKTNIERSIFFY